MSYAVMDRSKAYTVVREAEYRLDHTVIDGPPCEWSRARGATHTLYCGEGPGRGTRPAILKKTRLWVGVDELPGEIIKWETWTVTHRTRWEGRGR